MQPDRQWSLGSYRYGFNGKENDNEVKGEGNQQDYGFRIYDPRLGKFLSVDPLTKSYPELTPYQFASNSPIFYIDLDGAEGTPGAAEAVGAGGKTALRVATKEGVVQGAKIVTMRAAEKVAESPGFWKSVGIGFRSAGSGIVGAIIWTFTPVPNGPGANPEASTWWQEYRRLQDMPNAAPVGGKSFMEEDEDNNDVITLYRGVSADSKYPLMYEAAKAGIAIPKPLVSPVATKGAENPYLDMIPGGSGKDDAYWHSAGDNYTIWTSWSTDERVAKTFAKGEMGNSAGVILSRKFKKSLLTPAHSDHNGMGEKEFLVPGIVLGANVKKVPGAPKDN